MDKWMKEKCNINEASKLNVTGCITLGNWIKPELKTVGYKKIKI